MPYIVRYAALFYLFKTKAKCRLKTNSSFQAFFVIGGAPMKTCSFFGHRKIQKTEELILRLQNLLTYLIEQKGVQIFLFGSKSEFNTLCHEIVTRLKQKYPQIQRRVYTCRSEACVLEKERAYFERVYSQVSKQTITLLGFEEEVEHKTKYTAGKAQYIKRNQSMIDDSDFCVFYYDKEYTPPTKREYRGGTPTYQPNSGTKLAYEYAQKKKKQTINVF